MIDPKSTVVLRSPLTKFTWVPPKLSMMQPTYSPIWCFVGYRRLHLQPPSPLNPLVNILGADFEEIHDVDVIRIGGEYTTSPRYKKVNICIPACDDEPLIPDDTRLFFQ